MDPKDEKKRRNATIRMRNWRRKNRLRDHAQQKKYRSKHKEQIKARMKVWRAANRPKIRDYNNQWYKENPIAMNLRSRLYIALKKNQKHGRAIELLGCSIENFKIYLESLFEVGMTWGNYSHRGWHIDHIIPCALFDLSKPEHQKRCFHFSNMRPCWSKENWSKGSTATTNQFNLL